MPHLTQNQLINLKSHAFVITVTAICDLINNLLIPYPLKKWINEGITCSILFQLVHLAVSFIEKTDPSEENYIYDKDRKFPLSSGGSALKEEAFPVKVRYYSEEDLRRQGYKGNIPQHFFCPLSHNLLKEPVFVKDCPQQVMEFFYVEDILTLREPHPLTRKPFTWNDVVLDTRLKTEINAFYKKVFPKHKLLIFFESIVFKRLSLQQAVKEANTPTML